MNISPTFISTMYYFIKLTIKLTSTALFLFVITFFIGLLFNNTSAIELLVYGPSVQVLSALIGIVLAIPLAGLIGFMSKILIGIVSILYHINLFFTGNNILNLGR